MLTVIITTYNEAFHIADLLDNIQWADEIIVVDSFSADDTVAIAKSKGAIIYERAYEGPADQKNWAIQRASNEWILLLDADERVTPHLKMEVLELLKSPKNGVDAYWIFRQNYFLGKKIKYSGWQGDKVIRFFKSSCRYDDKQVHEEIVTQGIGIGFLKGKLDHYTYQNMDQFLDKMRRYAKWSAQDHEAKTGRIGLFHLWFKPAFRFVKHYFLKGGFRDGKAGFIISIVMAWGVFLRYVYMNENRKGNVKKDD